MYNAITKLRMEKGQLEKKRTDAERDRDVWKDRLAEQQRDNERLEEQQNDDDRDRDMWRRCAIDREILRRQLEEQQDTNDRDRETFNLLLQEADAKIERLQLEIQKIPQVAPPAPDLGKTALQDPQVIFSFRDIRQRVQKLVNNPLLSLDEDNMHRTAVRPEMEALKLFKSNDLEGSYAVLEVLFGNFRNSSWTEENRKSRLKGLIFKELFHSIFNSDPWLGNLKFPGPFGPDVNARNTLDRVSTRIADLLRVVQIDPDVESVAIQQSVQLLVNSAYAFRNQIGKSTPRYIVCDPFPEEDKDWLKDCTNFVEPLGFEGPVCRDENACISYTVFGGLIKISNGSSGAEECVSLERVQVVLIKGQGVTHGGQSDGKVAHEEEEDEL